MFDNIRNWLANEQSLIIAVVSFGIAVVPLFQKNGNISIRIKKFAAICACVCILVVVNYIDVTYMHDRSEEGPGTKPTSESLPDENTESVMSSVDDLPVESTENNLPSIDDQQDKSTEIDISSIQDDHDGQFPQNELSISINNDIEFFYNGFHYEYPSPENPDMNIIIDFDRGISGSFTYSRQLTEEERMNWSHGGRLYDESGNEIGSEGNYPTFWSSSDGKFAIEFPQDIENGRYKYELYQYVNDTFVSDYIYFDVVLPENTKENSKPDKNAQDVDSTTELDIYIDNWEYFNDGFYYENPDPSDPWFISYSKGISGNFHYSRELTQEEKNNWSHGGVLYDENGNEIGSEGNYPSFWSSPTGRFAIQFPEGLPQGKYTFKLYQFINNTQVSASIQFSVN